MKKSVTMKDIANKLNVSVVTVSKALGDKDGVGEELRNRILKCASDMGYRINGFAKSMKDGFSYNIGIVISERFIGTPEAFYLNFYQHISKLLEEHGYYGILQMLSIEDEENLTPPRAYMEKKVDGLILLGQLNVEYLDMIQNADVPIVMLDFYDERIDTDSVITDNFYGSYELTSYLIENGHTEIAFIGDINATSSIQDRFLGYYKALLSKRLEIKDSFVISDRDKDGKYIDFKLPEKMPTAFVCNNDQIAYNLINRLKDEGYKVPGEISVVGFDNSVYSSFSSPQITTMSVDVEEMARTAIRFILNRIKNEGRRYGRALIKGKMVCRGSVKILKPAHCKKTSV